MCAGDDQDVAHTLRQVSIKHRSSGSCFLGKRCSGLAELTGIGPTAGDMK